MKKLGILLIASSIFLIGCGSRTESTDEPGLGAAVFDENGNQVGGDPALGAAVAPQLNISVLSNVSSILTGDSETSDSIATITAVVTDESRKAVPDQQVDFSASGGTLQGIVDITDENGEASATITPKGDYRNQAITVVVSAEGFVGTVLLNSDGSAVEITGPESVQLNENVEFTVVLIAGDGNPIANQTVQLASTGGSVVTPTSGTTDKNGVLTAMVNSAAGGDTILVSALEGTASAEYSFFVSQDTLIFSDTTVTPEINVDIPQDITVQWISEGAPVVGEALRFSTTAGRLVSAAEVLTDVNGNATVTVISSSAGPATIGVEAAAGGDPSITRDVEFIATTPANLALDLSSTRVHTLGESILNAVVTDVNGNPVKNQEVAFTSADLKGGQINPATAITNSAGEASVIFTAGDNATQVDEISVVAEVLNRNINSSATMTVVERVLNITIGSSNKLESTAFDTQYRVAYVVQVADGGGTPIANADVAVSIEPLAYWKGELDRYDVSGNSDSSVEGFAPAFWDHAFDVVQCVSEDTNGNRILDPGEDINNNGALDPQDPALLSPSLASADSPDPLHTIEGGRLSTDATGSGYFDLLYPVSNSLWATVKITARAQALGAEAEDSYITDLKIDSNTATTIDSEPPSRFSPYGTNVFGGVAACMNVN